MKKSDSVLKGVPAIPVLVLEFNAFLVFEKTK